MMLVFAVGLAMLTLGVILGYAIKAGKVDKVSFDGHQQAELARYRKMGDALLDDALARVETDPFAMVVVDHIRQAQRGEVKGP